MGFPTGAAGMAGPGCRERAQIIASRGERTAKSPGQLPGYWDGSR